jgi:C-terminal processing protease CtpA/Prc
LIRKKTKGKKMKMKNTAIAIALAAASVLLIFILAGCSFGVGPFAVNISRRIPGQFNFNQKQFGTENKNFGNNQNLENPGNNQNIPFIGIEMIQSKDIKGVLVGNVIAGSSAEKAGIKPQDIITVFDGKAVSSPAELYSAVQSHKVGDNVKVTVSRNNQSMELNVTLGAFKGSIPNIEKNNQDIPFMGIEMSQTAPDIKGVLVNSVIAGSSAEKAGIKPQDIITAFDGKAVASSIELNTAVQSHKVGDNIKVTVNRNKQSMELNVTLGAFKDIMPNIEKNNQDNLHNSESESNQVY